jgi:hypothetical protein
MRDLIVTQRGVFLVGRQVEKSGPNKGQEIETVTRRIEFASLYQVSSPEVISSASGSDDRGFEST